MTLSHPRLRRHPEKVSFGGAQTKPFNMDANQWLAIAQFLNFPVDFENAIRDCGSIACV